MYEDMGTGIALQYAGSQVPREARRDVGREAARERFNPNQRDRERGEGELGRRGSWGRTVLSTESTEPYTPARNPARVCCIGPLEDSGALLAASG